LPETSAGETVQGLNRISRYDVKKNIRTVAEKCRLIQASTQEGWHEWPESRPDKAARITTWRDFYRKIEADGGEYLARLDDFESSILVTGCQRSGTTMLSRIITGSDGMTMYYFGSDDELAAALILAGYVNYEPRGRFCFQTTYLNAHYEEYLGIPTDDKIIWMLRNPYSVVYSMVYNWRRRALNHLYETCGKGQLQELGEGPGIKKRGRSDSPIVRACLSYRGKVSQVFRLRRQIESKQLLVVDYDGLVRQKAENLPLIYDHVGLKYHRRYADSIRSTGVSPRKFDRDSSEMIAAICLPIYQMALKLKDI
jgi:hypothetical protein